MDNNSLSIDLKKLKKPQHHVPMPLPPAPPPVVQQAPAPTPIQSTATLPAANPVQAPTQRMAPPVLPPKPQRQKSRRILVNAGVGLGIIVLIWGAYSIYSKFWTRSPFGPTPEGATQEQAAASATPVAEMSEAELVGRVAALMILPTDEVPVLAKVSDLSALKDQAFFKNAQVGHIVLMYQKASRAILYDPTANKIIEVGPIANATSTVAL